MKSDFFRLLKFLKSITALNYETMLIIFSPKHKQIYIFLKNKTGVQESNLHFHSIFRISAVLKTLKSNKIAFEVHYS